jgi:NCS1 family nucleobase:cation symporter-1
VLAALLAIFGHDWLHRVFLALFWVSLPFWVVLTIGVVTGHAGGHAPTASAFTWAGFLAQFTIAASYNITYSPYVSDYTRYLPRTTSTRSIVVSVFLGAAGSPIWLIPLGAWLGTRLGATDPLVGIHDAGNAVVGGLGSILAALAVLALVATMGLNAYSGMLTVVTGIDSLRPVKPTVRLRVVTIVVLSVVWLLLGLALTNATEALNNSLLIMLYLLAPWTAINLVDFFFIRRGHYAITDLFRPNGIYGAWSRRGVVAYLVGIVVEIPFMVLNGGAYTGWVAEHVLSSVDVSFILGMVVAGAIYLVTSRSLDRGAERAATQQSEELLADTGVAR